jgi:hypothetical protein
MHGLPSALAPFLEVFLFRPFSCGGHVYLDRVAAALALEMGGVITMAGTFSAACFPVVGEFLRTAYEAVCPTVFHPGISSRRRLDWAAGCAAARSGCGVW